MPHSSGKLPLSLVPASFPGETVASYAARIDAATGSTIHHLWTVAVSAYREKESLPARKRVSGEIGERETLALCRDLVGSRADDLVLLGRPSRTVWHACLLCTSGAVVAIHSKHARLVCPVHQTWTGPMVIQSRHLPFWAMPEPDSAHSQPVDGRIAEAAARIQASGAPDRVIEEALRRAASAVRLDWGGKPRPGDLPTAAAIIETVTDSDVIQAVCDPFSPYSAAYEVISRRMEQASNPLGDAGTDQAWLMLRWTAAAARYEWAGEWNTEDPAPVITPNQPSPSSDTLQPFHSYLDCLRANARSDQQWWDDKYCQATDGPRYLCPEGHVQRRRPYSGSNLRNSYQFSCTLCSGRRIVAGYNSLADKMPWLLDEWDPEAASGPTLWTVGAGSERMGHWICDQGHRWDATFYNRAAKGFGCPYCSGRRMIPGANDMASTHPLLAQMWDPDAGNKKTPREFKASNQKLRIVWRCPRGHTFVRTPSKLVDYGGRCQTCQGRILIPGVNDLATKRPDVAWTWNYARNGEFTPDQVKPGSGRMVWWICPRGHEFQERVVNRCHCPKLTCPIETGRILLSGVSDLATREPRLVVDWDYGRNDCRPDEIVPGRASRYWTCSAGHTQKASVVNRRKAGGCTLCPPSERVVPKVVKNRRRRWETQLNLADSVPG